MNNCPINYIHISIPYFHHLTKFFLKQNPQAELALFCIKKIGSLLESGQLVHLQELLTYNPDQFQAPKNLDEMMKLEDIYDICDMYLWMSMRCEDYFPCSDKAQELRSNIENWSADFLKLNSAKALNQQQSGFNRIKMQKNFNNNIKNRIQDNNNSKSTISSNFKSIRRFASGNGQSFKKTKN